MWYCNDTFHYMSKAEFDTLLRLKVPSGTTSRCCAVLTLDAERDGVVDALPEGGVPRLADVDGALVPGGHVNLKVEQGA